MVLWSRQPRLEGHCYALEPSAGGITVGRSEQSHIVLDDGSVSRCHARFERRVDGWWVVDQGSVNGTLVDGAQVRARRLRYGDRVQVGSTIFKVVHEHDDGRIVETASWRGTAATNSSCCWRGRAPRRPPRGRGRSAPRLRPTNSPSRGVSSR